METIVASVRGFVLTGDETYLERYRASKLSVVLHEASVHRLTADNPEQQRIFSALETLTAERIQRADLNINLRRTQGFAAAEDAIRGQPGEQATTDFLTIVSKMQNEERRLLAIRDADATRHSNQTNAILSLAIVLGLLITGTAFWCVQRDNSRRWLAERTLRDNEERYRLLIRGVKDYAIFMLDPKGNVASWNEGAERIKGYKADEIVGEHFSVFYPPEELAREKPAGELIQAAAEGKYEEDGWRLRKDGSRFWAHVLITPVRRENGELRGFSKVTQDITERKKAEELILEQMRELSRSVEQLQQFRELVRRIKDYAIFMLDPTGNVTTWNEGAERIKGYKASEIIGQHFSRFYTPEDLATGKPSRELLVAVADGKYEEEGWRLRNDGSHFWANVIIVPLRDDDGELRGFCKITRDITARKAAEALLSEKIKELNHSNEELGQFATVAAHDLQEPLRMVSEYLALLSRRYRGKLGADADEFIAFALDGASRMQRLINGLLHYSRVGAAGLKLQNISSEKSLQRAIVNLHGVIEASGALVTHDPPPPVMADEIQLDQLFQNLVGNAIKYQNSGVPKIHVSAVMNGEHKWNFSVQDNGIGIDSKNVERIFGMFQRLHGLAEFEGTGIGLAICKKIVERHGGDISVESQLGQGSIFHFDLAEGTTAHDKSLLSG